MVAENRRGRGLAAALVLLLLWIAAAESGLWSAYLLPSPQQVARALWQMLRSGELIAGAWMSLRRVFCGFTMALAASLLLGIGGCLVPAVLTWLEPVIHFLRHVPPLSMISLLILWFGIGELSKVLLIFLAAFFPMFLNMEKGFSGCDRALLEVGQSFAFSRWQLFWRIRLPYALPDILTGMQIGWGYGWRAIVGAEMIAAGSGLGYLILDAQYLARSDKVIAGILTIGLIGCLCNALFCALLRRVNWGGDANV